MRGVKAKAIRRLNRSETIGMEQVRYRTDKKTGVVSVGPSTRYFEKTLKRLFKTVPPVREQVETEVWLSRLLRVVD